jgi:hypothetical protein
MLVTENEWQKEKKKKDELVVDASRRRSFGGIEK